MARQLQRHRPPFAVSLALILLSLFLFFCHDARAVEQSSRNSSSNCKSRRSSSRTSSSRTELLTSGISGAALVEQIGHLATLSSSAPPAVTRLLFSPEDIAARAYVKELMREAGLRVHEDAVGNIFGIWDVEDDDESGTTKTTTKTQTKTTEATTETETAIPNAVALPRGLVLSGSHTDAIPLAGAYDGVVGVVGAIAAIGSLRSASLSSPSRSSSASNENDSPLFFRPRRPLAAVMFSSEEPTRFGLSCLGSRALAGELRAEELASLRDVAGGGGGGGGGSEGGGGSGGGGTAAGGGGVGFFELADAAGVPRAAGSSSDALSRAEATLSSVKLVSGNNSRKGKKKKKKKKKNGLPSVSSFVELHIEQAAALELAGAPLGVVTAIAAPAALDVTFRGPGGHAGSLPMRLRADAGLAAAAFALDVERIALDASRGEGDEEMGGETGNGKSGGGGGGGGGGGDDSVATVGMISLIPGAVNSVPREAKVSVDVRDVDGARRDRMLWRIKEAAARRAGERRGGGGSGGSGGDGNEGGARVEVDVRTVSEDAPATAAAEVVRAAERAVVAVTGAVRQGDGGGGGKGEGEEKERRHQRRHQRSFSSRLLLSLVSRFLPFSSPPPPPPPPPPPLMLLPSRAYHDALFVSRVAETGVGMIFVRCRGGWSHRPDEFASEGDVEAGAKALALALAELAEDGGGGGGGEGTC